MEYNKRTTTSSNLYVSDFEIIPILPTFIFRIGNATHWE